MNYLTIFLSVSISWCINLLCLNDSQSSVDSVFLSWNKATWASLTRQKGEARDSALRAHCENRLDALRDVFFAIDSTKIDFQSLRYKFLKKLFSDLKFEKNEFYIIEANISGARVIMRNYVVYPNSTYDVHVDVYLYGIKGWFKKAEVKNLTFTLVDGFEEGHVKRGCNDDDIIVTKFEKNTVKYSEYFLYGTLSKSSGIEEILAVDNTKHFK